MTKDGDATHLSIEDVPKPSTKSGELLVKIRASFVQPADILNSKGGFPTTTYPRILGKDFAGTVIGGSDQWIGKDVYGTSGMSFSFTEDGAQAEYAVLKEDCVALKPSTLSFAQAASVGTPWSTALTVLLRARAKPSDTVMVLGATGSVGSSVMQIAAERGSRTISVGRHSTDVNSVEDPHLKKAIELTGGKGPDVIVDTVGDLALTKAALSVLAIQGRLAFITTERAGSTELAVDIKDFYRRQLELVGCNTAGMPQVGMMQIMKQLTSGFESGKLKAAAENTMTLLGVDQAADAYSGKAKRAVIVFD